jgi:hypothetical protein
VTAPDRPVIASILLALGVALGGWAPGVNEGAQLQKIVRVVSTVQYFLK